MDNINVEVEQILNELRRAESIHPGWPEDVIHMASIMMEEAGEAVQAANDSVYKGGDAERLKTELRHTAAMCLRCLINLQSEVEG